MIRLDMWYHDKSLHSMTSHGLVCCIVDERFGSIDEYSYDDWGSFLWFCFLQENRGEHIWDVMWSYRRKKGEEEAGGKVGRRERMRWDAGAVKRRIRWRGEGRRQVEGKARKIWRGDRVHYLTTHTHCHSNTEVFQYDVMRCYRDIDAHGLLRLVHHIMHASCDTWWHTDCTSIWWWLNDWYSVELHHLISCLISYHTNQRKFKWKKK